MKKDIRGYEGLYYVTDEGGVFSYGGKSNHKDAIQLKPSLDKDGYKRYTLQNNKHRAYFRGCRLVVDAFIDNPLNKPMVNHIDENKQNDNADNLEWTTGYENWKHSEHKSNSKEIIVYKICKTTGNVLGEYHSLMEAGRANNINQGNITNCIKGRCKSVGGFFWEQKAIHYLEKKIELLEKE